MSTLYVVATPIGNLEDITLRALRVLREVALIAAEDTRTARKLLARHAIHTPLTSFFEHSRLPKLDYLLHTLAENDVALISEAGMPGLSDPGYELIRAAIERGLPVVAIPGPSAITTALAVSGLPSDQFVYLGFLPRRPTERRRLLTAVAAEPRTLVAFEAPHRLLACLSDLASILGEQRRLAVCRELTKAFEEVRRETVAAALAHFRATAPRGEFTLVIAGATAVGQAGSLSTGDAAQVRGRVAGLVASGIRRQEAIKQVARETGLPRREVYRLVTL
jgi:16S rRNA (cytidine1402-2'-O)-methyltransferase